MPVVLAGIITLITALNNNATVCMFNKDLEEIKSQSIMNNAITKIKSTLEGTNRRITEAKDSISEMEDRMVDMKQAERKKELKEMRTT